MAAATLPLLRSVARCSGTGKYWGFAAGNVERPAGPAGYSDRCGTGGGLADRKTWLVVWCVERTLPSRNPPKKPLKNVASDGRARREGLRKRNVHLVHEHSESLSNNALSSA